MEWQRCYTQGASVWSHGEPGLNDYQLDWWQEQGEPVHYLD